MDFPFVKEAISQLFSKPSTVPYPFVPAPAKPNYRGRIVFHPDKCINCNMCERVCAGQAISHVSEPCEEGERITRSFYLGSCTFCAHCASFCTHGAIELSDDYHMVATKEEDLIVSGTVIKKPPVKKAPAAKPAPAPAPAEPVKEEAKPEAVEEKPKAEAAEEPKAEAEAVKAPKAKKAKAAEEPKPEEVKAPEESKPEEVKAPEEPKPEETAAEETKAAPPEPRDDGKPVQDPSKCVYCTLCAKNCPAGALTVDRKAKTWTLDEDACLACGTCQGACPKDAIIM